MQYARCALPRPLLLLLLLLPMRLLLYQTILAVLLALLQLHLTLVRGACGVGP
jgi:hypothetical protein